jgi:phosphate-selective porin OprO and OprP
MGETLFLMHVLQDGLIPYFYPKEEEVKKKILAVVLLAAACAAQSAGAKTLEDVLKEKGVITEEDYKAVTKSKPLDYKLGKGFTFTSPDEKFQLALGGRMQFRYNYFDKDGTPNSSQWQTKRIKFYTNGFVYNKDLTYGLQADFVNGNNVRLLDDAFMNYRLLDEVQIRVGQFKTPFVRQEMISDGNLQLVDRSIVADNFKQGRDIGAMLHGKFAGGLLTYGVGGFGGAGQSTPRTSNNNALVGRIAVNPFGEMAYSEADLDAAKKPLMTVGASYLKNTLQKTGATAFADVDPKATAYFGKGWLGTGVGKFGNTEKVDVNSVGIDAAFKWQGLSIQGEYLLGQADGQITNNTLRAQGFYAQAGYCIIPSKLEAAVRYSFMDQDRDKSNDLQSEIAGGLSYYFDKHNLKIQSDVANLHTQPARTDEIQYRVQAQLTF